VRRPPKGTLGAASAEAKRSTDGVQSSLSTGGNLREAWEARM
jgi:hypothetical protein